MKILAVGAHPDDVEFGCAPILIQEVRNGHEARILVTSKGEAASAGTPEERAQEARDAARIIGAAIQFLELGGDCHIENNTANAMTLAREIRRFKPDVVLAPHLGENQHPDHAAVGKIVRDAARLARFGGLRDLEDLPPHPITSLYFYTITQVFVDPPELVVDVSRGAGGLGSRDSVPQEPDENPELPGSGDVAGADAGGGDRRGVCGWALAE